MYCVAWNLVRRDQFVSTSWDDSAKLWSAASRASVRTLREHAYCVYSAAWNPRSADVFATASGDCTLKARARGSGGGGGRGAKLGRVVTCNAEAGGGGRPLARARAAPLRLTPHPPTLPFLIGLQVWDARTPFSAATLPAGCGHELLSVDWNGHNEALVATGGVDKAVRVWDLRSPGAPLAAMAGHGYAVRRVRWSPFAPGLLLSASYDMTARLWDVSAAAGGGGGALLRVWDHHTEFVVGLDASALTEGLAATCGWDNAVTVFPAA